MTMTAEEARSLNERNSAVMALSGLEGAKFNANSGTTYTRDSDTLTAVSKDGERATYAIDDLTKPLAAQIATTAQGFDGDTYWEKIDREAVAEVMADPELKDLAYFRAFNDRAEWKGAMREASVDLSENHEAWGKVDSLSTDALAAFKNAYLAEKTQGQTVETAQIATTEAPAYVPMDRKRSALQDRAAEREARSASIAERQPNASEEHSQSFGI